MEELPLPDAPATPFGEALSLPSPTLLASHPIPNTSLKDFSLPTVPYSPIGEAMSPSPPDSSDSGYFLMSCFKVAFGGLGHVANLVSKGRGRKSFTVKAQSKAKKDHLEGKQQSIERALRAVHAQNKGRR